VEKQEKIAKWKLLFPLIFLSFRLLAQSDLPKLQISKLATNSYVFTTYRLLGEDPFPANGLYMVGTTGVYMVDTPWDTTQFQPLLDSIEARHHLPVKMIVATHSHDDRTGGLAFYAQKGIPTYTSKATDILSKRKGEKRAQFHFVSDTTFNWDGTLVQTFYPGHGHSPDNIVVWFENEGILYGGCMVKSVEATNLGNLEDADVKKWEVSMLKLIDRYKSVKWVVPGHQEWSGKVALKHTLNLINGYQRSVQGKK
jgi:metallo-beta-lactamase class B